MANKLLPISPPAGLFQNGTRYQAKGRWYQANLVRFFSGTLQPVGGWQKLTLDGGTTMSALTGLPRASIGWRLTDESPVMAFFTLSKLYCMLGGAITDITPSGFTAGVADSTAQTGNASGNFGDGNYGIGLYGSGPLTGTPIECDVSTVDVFGTYLVALSTSDHILYVWDGNPSDVAVVATASIPTYAGGTTYNQGDQVVSSSIYYQSLVSSNTGNTPATSPTFWAVIPAPGDPPKGIAVFCTPERFVVVLGAEDRNPDGSLTGNLNGRLVAWASQETYTDWTPSALNTAGDFPITTQGRLVAGKPVRGYSLIWSDCDVWTMTATGDQFVYAFAKVGDKCGLVAPNAAVVVDGNAYWMGTENFFSYNGFVQTLPCDVRDKVFENFNGVQQRKVHGYSVSQFGEIWWFYPSANSQECDSYVVYNYRENHWTTGTLSRLTGFDSGAIGTPVALGLDKYAYAHETGTLHPGAGLIFIESGPLEIGDGDRLMAVERMLPDEKNLGDTQTYVYTAINPTDTEQEFGPFSNLAPTGLRFKGRQIRLRYEQVNEVAWRIGTMRVAAHPSSGR